MSNDLNDGQFEKCKGWWKPTFCTSDYFNRCSGSTVGIPANFWGYQESYAGDGYVGLLPSEWQMANGIYVGFEYIQTKLLKPLIPCTEYHFEMHVNFANYSRFGYSRLGAYFSENPIHTDDCNALTLSPQILNNQGLLIDTVNWVTISGNYVAESYEQYLTIGYFFDNVQNDTVRFQEPQVIVETGYGYYYIDNVSVTEVGPVLDCNYIPPNVITPNNDGLNDLWKYSGSSEGELSIVNRWGIEVYHGKGYSFSWDGGDCVDGVYYFNYTSEKFNKTGFIQLIR